MFLLSSVFLANSQEKSNEINRSQLTLMVVPFTTKGEDLREKIESDFNYRATISAISKAFEDRGYTTIDFIERLKSTSTSNIKNDPMSQTDLWKEVQKNSPSDIFLQTEVYIYKGNGNKVQLLISALDKYSGEKLASSGLIESNTMYTDDFAKLAVQALTKDAAIDKFMESLNIKFNEISSNGRSVEVRLELSTASRLKFDDEIGSDYDLLSDIITDWVKINSFKNNYHVKAVSSNLLWFDIIKIPVRNSDNSNFLPDDFARQFRVFLRKLSSKVSTGELKVDMSVTGSKIDFILK
jgi:hypothetical protein